MTEHGKNRDWEKCARLFLLNSPVQIHEMRELLQKILSNIIEYEGDEKYLTVKSTNKIINSKLLERHGGVEFLIAAGFNCMNDNTGIKVYVFSITHIDSLPATVQWLNNTMLSCLELHAQKPTTANNDSTCCECTIQIRLPTGASVSGGFMQGDSLQDVLDFASCYFQPDRADAVRLMIPPSSRYVDEDSLRQSLRELKLFPRALLIASALSEEDRLVRLQQSHERVEQAEVRKVTSIVEQKKKKADEKLQREQQRASTLSAFREDHEKRDK